MTPTFEIWASVISQKMEDWGPIVANGCRIRKLTEEEQRAYEAPFPSEEYKAATRVMPHIVPSTKEHASVEENLGAWKRVLHLWEKPFLTLFGDRDAISKGLEKPFQQLVPGAKGQPHAFIKGAGHFFQEDSGPEIAEKLINFVNINPSDHQK